WRGGSGPGRDVPSPQPLLKGQLCLLFGDGTAVGRRRSSGEETGGMATGTRRRGAALETALLDAARAELVEKGYANFTIEGVAERAKTGRQVVYRRWANRWDLLVATVSCHLDPVAVPDTGSLRGDLIAYLVDASAKRAELATLLMLNLAHAHIDGG